MWTRRGFYTFTLPPEPHTNANSFFTAEEPKASLRGFFEGGGTVLLTSLDLT